MDELHSTIYIDELFQSVNMDKLLLHNLHRQARLISQHGRAPTLQFTLTSSSSQSTWTSPALLFVMTSSSLQSTWMSSYSTIYIDKLVPSVNMDEPRSTIHHDELVPSVNMDELLLHNLHRQVRLISQHGRAPLYNLH